MNDNLIQFYPEPDTIALKKRHRSKTQVLIRILDIMKESDEAMVMSKIAFKSRLAHYAVEKYLYILCNIGIIYETKTGRNRYFSMKKEGFAIYREYKMHLNRLKEIGIPF